MAKKKVAKPQKKKMLTAMDNLGGKMKGVQRPKTGTKIGKPPSAR